VSGLLHGGDFVAPPERFRISFMGVSFEEEFGDGFYGLLLRLQGSTEIAVEVGLDCLSVRLKRC
jgi:hypothetical protein